MGLVPVAIASHHARLLGLVESFPVQHISDSFTRNAEIRHERCDGLSLRGPMSKGTRLVGRQPGPATRAAFEESSNGVPQSVWVALENDSNGRGGLDLVVDVVGRFGHDVLLMIDLRRRNRPSAQDSYTNPRETRGLYGRFRPVWRHLSAVKRNQSVVI